jgi:hypothetical protein
MRKFLILTLLATASLAVAAQQDKRTEQQPQSSGQKSAQDESPIPPERARVDGAAGGTTPLPDEKRKAVGAGAGPHLRDNLPSPQKLPRDKPVEPSK